MKASAAGLRMIEDYEGFGNDGRPYWDAYGRVWTRGYGEAKGITADSPQISRAEAQANLQKLLAEEYEPPIARIGVELNQNQWDALCDFVWNIGPGGVEGGSPVCAALRAGKYRMAANTLLDYDRAGGVVLAGLVTRRQAERLLFLTPVANPLDVLTPAERTAVDELDKLKHGLRLHAVKIQETKTELVGLRKDVWRAAVRGVLPDGKPTATGWSIDDREARYRILRSRTAG